MLPHLFSSKKQQKESASLAQQLQQRNQELHGQGIANRLLAANTVQWYASVLKEYETKAANYNAATQAQLQQLQIEQLEIAAKGIEPLTYTAALHYATEKRSPAALLQDEQELQTIMQQQEYLDKTQELKR